MCKMCTDLYSDPRLNPRLAMDKSKVWKPGQTIGITFLGGTQTQKDLTIRFAEEWLLYANLRFDWVGLLEGANIRIAFQKGKGSWSYVGRDALSINVPDPTMNFGWLEDETDDDEWSRTVKHEFGHMLGCVHEYQSPAAGIKWDLPALYKYYWETQSWSKEQVDFNIVQKYNRNISNTEFDRESIMLYPIDQRFTLDQFEVGWNRQLSDTDKRFISEIYP